MSHTLSALKVAAALTATPPVDVRTLGLSDDELDDVYFEFLDAGLIRKDDSIAGARDIALLPERRAAVRRLGKSYSEAAVQRALLVCVQDPDNSRSIGPAELERVCALVGGVSLGDAERSLKQLMEDGYVDGTATWGADILRPQLTTSGIRALRDDLWPLGAAHSPAAVVTQTLIGQQVNTGSGSHVAAAQGASSSATLNHNEGVSPQTFTEIIQRLRDLSENPELSDGDRSLIQDQAETLEDIGEPIRTNPGRLRRALAQLESALISSGAQAAVQTLTSLIPIV